MVIKSTQMYHGVGKSYAELPKSALLQMMGRAGRPQFDDHGVVVIMVSLIPFTCVCALVMDVFLATQTAQDKVKQYTNLDSQTLDPVESCLPNQRTQCLLILLMLNLGAPASVKSLCSDGDRFVGNCRGDHWRW